MGNDEEHAMIRVSPDTRDRLHDFASRVDFSNAGQGVDYLLDMIDNIDVDGAIGDVINEYGGVTVELPGTGKRELLQIGGEPVVMLPDTGEPSTKLSPLTESQHTSGVVYCPVCWSEVFSYDLDDRYPSLETVFSELELVCPKCGSKRDEFTLIVRPKTTEKVPTDALYPAARKYWIARILRNGLSNTVFVDRVLSYKSVVEDRGEAWLPDPEDWLDLDDLKYVGDMTKTDYVTFVERYLENLEVFGGNTPVFNTYYDSSGENSCCSLTNDHIHVEAADAKIFASDIQQLTTDWSHVEANVLVDDESSFSSESEEGKELVVEFDGLDDVVSSDDALVESADEDTFDNVK